MSCWSPGLYLPTSFSPDLARLCLAAKLLLGSVQEDRDGGLWAFLRCSIYFLALLLPLPSSVEPALRGMP